MGTKKDAASAQVDAVVSKRFVWVFEVMEPTFDGGCVWNFVKYLATEYDTECQSEAISMAGKEYGYLIRGAQRRELTFEEYCGLLRCNNEGEHNEKVYQAMLRIVFTGLLSSCSLIREV